MLKNAFPSLLFIAWYLVVVARVVGSSVFVFLLLFFFEAGVVAVAVAVAVGGGGGGGGRGVLCNNYQSFEPRRNGKRASKGERKI